MSLRGGVVERLGGCGVEEAGTDGSTYQLVEGQTGGGGRGRACGRRLAASLSSSCGRDGALGREGQSQSKCPCSELTLMNVRLCLHSGVEADVSEAVHNDAVDEVDGLPGASEVDLCPVVLAGGAVDVAGWRGGLDTGVPEIRRQFKAQ